MSIDRLNNISNTGMLDYARYGKALEGLSAKQIALALSTKQLSDTELEEIIRKNNLIEKYGAEELIKVGLLSTNSALLASEKTLSAEKLVETMVEAGANKERAEAFVKKHATVVANEEEVTSEVILTRALLDEAVANNILQKENAESILSKEGVIATDLKEIASKKALKKALKEEALARGKALLTNPVTWLVAVVALLAACTAGYDAIIKRREKLAREKIETLGEDISKLDEEINSLEALHTKLEEAKGDKTELSKIQSELNDVIGETTGLLNAEGKAYDIANAKLKANIELKKQQRKRAQQDKVDAYKDLFNDTTLKLKGIFGIDWLAPDETGDSMRMHAKAMSEAGLTDEQYVALTGLDGNQDFTVEEWKKYWNDQVDMAYEIFADTIDTYDGIDGQSFIKGLISSAVRGGFDLSEISNIVNEVIDNQEMQDAINNYWESLVNPDINSEEALQSVKNIFDEIITTRPELKEFFDNFYNDIISGSKLVAESIPSINEPKVLKWNNEEINKAVDEYQDMLNKIQQYSNQGELTYEVKLDIIQEFSDKIDWDEYGINATSSTEEFTNALRELATKGYQGLIDKYPQLRDSLEGLADKIATLTNLTDSMSSLKSGAQLLQEIDEEIKEGNDLTLDNLQSILKTYPELSEAVAEYSTGILSTTDLFDELEKAYQKNADAYKDSLYQQLIATDDYVMRIGQEYSKDFLNWKNLQMAKAGLELEFWASRNNQYDGNTTFIKDEVTGEYIYDDTMFDFSDILSNIDSESYENQVGIIADIEAYKASVEIQIKRHNELLKKFGEYEPKINGIDTSWKNIANSADDVKNSTNDALTALHKLIDLRVDMIKDMKQDEIDALEDIIDKEKEKLDLINEQIDARKEAIELLKDERDHEEEMTEKNKVISDIQSQIDALSYDDSASGQKKRRELQEELVEAKKDLADYITDYEYEKAIEALDKESEAAEKAYEEEEARLQKEIDDIEKFLNDEKALIEQAMNDINGMSNVLYEEMKTWGEETTGEIWEIVEAWEEARKALEKYNAVNKVPEIHETLHQEKLGVNDTSNNTVDNKTSTNVSTDNANEVRYHTVKSTSDNMWNLAVKYYGDGNKWTKIQEANGGIAPESLQIGQKLIIPYYQDGTNKVPKDTLAIVDEVGKELILRANNQGRLDHLTLGSSVVPADITEKLLAWGQTTPNLFAQNLAMNLPKFNIPDVIRRDNTPTISIGDIYINGNIGNLTKSDLNNFRKDIVNDVYESMQRNRVKSGRY